MTPDHIISSEARSRGLAAALCFLGCALILAIGACVGACS